MDMAAQRIQEPATSAAKRARWRRIVRNVVLGIAGAIFAVWLVLYITKGRFLKGPFQTIVSRMTNRPVTVRGDFQLYFAPFDIKFRAGGMTIGNPAWATRRNLFEAQLIDTRIAPLSLLWGKRRVKTLLLDRAAFDLEWSPDHRTNSWTFSEKKGEPLDFPRIDRAIVQGTTLRYRDPRMQLLADLQFEPIRADTRKGIGDAVALSGTGRVRRTPFTVTAQLLSPNETVAQGRNQLTAQMRAANNIIDISGTLPSLADIEDVPLKVRSRGRNMAELLAIIDVAIPNTRRYRVSGQMVKSGNEYRFTRLVGTAGDSDLAGRLTIRNAERIHLDSVLTTRKLDIVDAAPFIGFNPD
ncbi:MAG TPA: AsmA family protein, partial [Sphingomonas sp.]